jgi:hypothetical protein
MAVGKFVNKGAAGGGTLTLTLREYTAGDTWTKPTGLAMVEVVCVGAGGGGGSGARRASGVASRGGGGGGGGTVSYAQILAASLASTVTVTIGAGGNGGAAVTADNTGGSAGSNGGSTSFGSHCVAPGGVGAGTDGAVFGAISLSASYEPDFAFGACVGGVGRPSPSAGTIPATGVLQELSEAGSNFSSNPGAGAGGGVTTANVASGSALGGGIYNYSGSLNTRAAAAAVGGNGNNGTNNWGNRMCQTQRIRNASPSYAIGASGSAGGGNTTGAGGNGGNGGNYGGAGAGGGGTRNGFNSGAGGNGAGGLCFVLEYTIT